jgi:hypothetical protein
VPDGLQYPDDHVTIDGLYWQVTNDGMYVGRQCIFPLLTVLCVFPQIPVGGQIILCAAELCPGRGLPVRLEPRDRADEPHAGYGQGGARAALSQPDAVCFDLGDARVDAAKDPIPQFITMKLDRADLKAVPQMNGGAGIVLRRRVLGPAVFYTPWSYVDHLIVQSGASIGTSRMADMSEAYYVISGDGSVTVDGETVAIKIGDAIPVDLGQSKSFTAGTAPLELMVVGIARDMRTKNAFVEVAENAN